MSSNNNYAEDTPFLFKLLRTPAFRFIVVNHNYYGFVRQIREDLQTRYPDRPIRSMDVEKHDFRAIVNAYDELGSGFLLVENFEQALKDSDQADEQQRRTGITNGLNRTRDRLALQPTALIVFMFDSAEAPNVPRLMQRMPDMWSFRAFVLDLHKQYEAPNPDLRTLDTATRSVHISTLGGNTQEEKLQELDRLNKLLLTTTDISTLKTTYKQIAQIQQDVGHYLNAVQTWQKVQDIEEDLFQKNSIYIEQGDLYRTAGELTQALQCYEKALGKIEKNSRQHSFILERIGTTRSDMGNLQNALDIYGKSIEIDKKILEKNPKNSDLKNSLGISYSKLGSIHSRLGNLDKALAFFELGVEFTEQLYKIYPQNLDFKSNLGSSYEKLGSMYSSLGNWDKASTFFEQFNELMEQLYKSYPQNAAFKNGLAISYEKLGETHTSLGNLNKALEFFEDETVLFEQLYEAYPSNVSFKNGLAISYHKLGEFYRDKKNDKNQARAYFRKCYDLLSELSQSYSSYVEFKNNFNEVKEDLENL